MSSARRFADELIESALPGAFDPADLRGLPEPVRRYFTAALAPGTPLARSAWFRMHGSIKLNASWRTFRAWQVESPHKGFIWAARTGVVMGSDRYIAGSGGMDWRLLGLVRIVHAAGPDTTRSAAGRAGAEAIWTPTALLPQQGVTWAAIDDSHIAASYRLGDHDVDLRLTIGPDGLITSVVFDRWGDPDNTGTWRYLPFGFAVAEQRTYDGITIPVSGRAGWHFGTGRWSSGEFFRSEIVDYRLLP